jgi:probable phosphoglycerate mutase
MPEDNPIPRTTQFWLVRHGQTDWNLEGRYQGQADTPLNQTGLQEAQAVARQLATVSFEAIYSSDLLRARQTAAAIGQTAGITVQLDQRLREVSLGQWEGQLFDHIKVRYPAEIEQRQRDPVHFRPPGGETLAELWLRVSTAVKEIARKHAGEEVILVSHGLALGALVASIELHDLAQAYQQIPPNATPTRLDWPLNLQPLQKERENAG